ncbi:MAG TPA: hypothetical protein VHL31_00755 [Geminicoccus sp.]|jgi:hypothetical protein|uniref:hypothetical protein n=1 Tax=Geminicoccus sp. TaxID=2024832 RepID=UPI002E37B08D|nr:hypothetical protein [Geminicoccus sp.]HEX2524820.1 hypothetical protein [Geminicoccus sp.]
MNDITITGLSMIKNSKPNAAGAKMLAFNCEVRIFALSGCAFVKTTKNGLTTNAL